ncbi:MAG TPA: DMT family transporter [Coriobacteriia bacterium]|nr:DMT family transporter [Coriobacteriia bacterium]
MVKRYGIGTMASVAVTVLIWSTTFAALVAALRHFTPQHLLFLRWTLTAVLFVGFGAVTRMRLPDRADLPKIALAGVLGFAAYQMLLVNGQMGVSATMAGFLVNMSPLFTTVIAVSLGRDDSRRTTWAGIALCTLGLLVMAQGKGGFGDIGPSAGLVVLAALSFALYTLVTKPLLSKYRPIEVTTYALVAGAAPFLVFAPGSVEALASASAIDLGNLLFLAIFPGGVAYVLWARSVKGLTPGLASRFLYLIPVLGVPVAWLWVGEVPQLITVGGGLLTIFGVAVASMRPKTAPTVPLMAVSGGGEHVGDLAVEAA